MLEPFELLARNLAIDRGECLWCEEGQLIMMDRQNEIKTKAKKSIIGLAMLTDPEHDGDPQHANLIFMDETLKFRSSIPVPFHSRGWFIGQDKYDLRKLGLTKEKWDIIKEFVGNGKELEIIISHLYTLFKDEFNWNTIYYSITFLSKLTQSGFLISSNDSGVVFVNECIDEQPFSL